jgi:DNA-binding response OmpR family regulator
MLKILIAEDDLMIADAAEEILLKYGYEVCGIARTVACAVALAHSHKPDIVVADLKLADDGRGTEILSHFDARRFGVLYTTGDISHLMSMNAKGDACLAKPYHAADLLRSIELVAQIVGTGTTSHPIPRGFRVLPSTSTMLQAEVVNG